MTDFGRLKCGLSAGFGLGLEFGSALDLIWPTGQDERGTGVVSRTSSLRGSLAAPSEYHSHDSSSKTKQIVAAPAQRTSMKRDLFLFYFYDKLKQKRRFKAKDTQG